MHVRNEKITVRGFALFVASSALVLTGAACSSTPKPVSTQGNAGPTAATTTGPTSALESSDGTASSGRLSAADVSARILAQLKAQGVPVDNGQVSCQQDLPAAVGKVVRCEFVTGGQPVDAVVSVTSVAGDDVRFDITTEARPIAQSTLAQKVNDQIGKLIGKLDSSVCSGDLQPQVGQTQTCTVTQGAEQHVLKVTVTAVDGGLISFSINEE